jgi:hypothetical protein
MVKQNRQLGSSIIEAAMGMAVVGLAVSAGLNSFDGALTADKQLRARLAMSQLKVVIASVARSKAAMLYSAKINGATALDGCLVAGGATCSDKGSVATALRDPGTGQVMLDPNAVVYFGFNGLPTLQESGVFQVKLTGMTSVCHKNTPTCDVAAAVTTSYSVEPYVENYRLWGQSSKGAVPQTGFKFSGSEDANVSSFLLSDNITTKDCNSAGSYKGQTTSGHLIFAGDWTAPLKPNYLVGFTNMGQAICSNDVDIPGRGGNGAQGITGASPRGPNGLPGPAGAPGSVGPVAAFNGADYDDRKDIYIAHPLCGVGNYCLLEQIGLQGAIGAISTW